MASLGDTAGRLAAGDLDARVGSGHRLLAVAPPDGTAVLTLIQPEPDSPQSRLIGRAENPTETLDYSYEKQLELLQNVKRGVADVVTSKKRLQLQTTKLEQDLVKLEEQARQALAGGREDLARRAQLDRNDMYRSLVGYIGAKHAVEVVLTQAQESAPYALDVEVAMTGEQGETRHVVKLRERTARSRFTPSGKIADVRLDPDHRLLIWDPEYGPRP